MASAAAECPVLSGELERVTTYIFQQTERRADLDSFQAGVLREDVADLVKGQGGGAHREMSNRHPRNVTVGLTIQG